jgi:hypothetical protein
MATLVDYVYSEIQEVARNDHDPSDASMNGRLVVAVRLDAGPGRPSEVLILPVEHAARLRDDLTRALEEFDRMTEET